MGKSSKLFNEEKIGKLLFRFSVPIIIGFLISELYSMVDTIFVGNYVGPLGIGALILVFPIQRIMYAISILISTGSSTTFSRELGKGDIEKSKKIINNGFTFTLGLMIILTIIVYLLKEKLLISLGASLDILPSAREYLGGIIFGSIFLSLTIYISNIMMSLGNNKMSIISNSIGAIVNVILDFILVGYLGMGVKGAAIATTVSQIIGFSYAFYKFIVITKENNIDLKIELDKRIIIPILTIGLSAFVVEAEDGILMAVLNNLLADTAGDKGVVVLGVVSKIYMFLFITMFGIASAMQPIAAYNVGAKNYRRLKSVMKKTTLYAFITSVVLWIGMIIFAPQLISIFIKDKELILESAKAFRVMVSVFPIVSIYYVSIYYFQAMGRVSTSLMVCVLRQIIIMIPLSLILVKGFNMGAMGVWLSYPIADILSSTISYMLIRYEGIELEIIIERQSREKLA
ncbi:MAG: MATE family efflux transporter [Tissierellaceae bacterium]|nr:MATE family efflux transporter [Tissierellaceae bacterium]